MQRQLGPVEMKARRNASPGINEFKVGDRIMVQLTAGRLVDAEIKAIIETIRRRFRISLMMPDAIPSARVIAPSKVLDPKS